MNFEVAIIDRLLSRRFFRFCQTAKGWMKMKNVRDLFPSKEKKLAVLGGIVLIALTGAIMYNSSLLKKADTAPKQETVKAVVDVKIVQPADMSKKVSLVGQTVPAAQVDIVAKYSGRVVSVDVELGQQVRGGQTLLVQDTGDLELAIAQADASRRQAQADASETAVTFEAGHSKAQVDYQRALASYERYKSLYDMGAVSREAFETVQQQMLNAKANLNIYVNQSAGGASPAAVEVKRAAVMKAERNIDALSKQRDDMIIRSPRDGVIGFRQVEVGAYVQPGQKILSVVDNSSIFVDCQVSEQDVAAMQVGQTVEIGLEALGRTYSGKVIYVSPAADSKTQAFVARIALTNPDQAVKTGMFARGQIEVMQKPQALFIPKEALLEKNGQYSIFVIADNKAESRTVKIGLRNDKEVEIISGLKAGDMVAVSNLSRLRPGMEVTTSLLEENTAKPRGGR